MRRLDSVPTVGNRAARRAAQRQQRRARRAERRRRRPLAWAGLRLATTTAMLASLVTFGAAPAGATSFQVTNLNDAGAGSLREAIAQANATAGADTVTFAPGLTGTIPVLTAQLTLTESVQILGPGRSVLTLDGGGTNRVFDIPLSPGDVEVSISGLTVSNGRAQTGGGIRVQDERLNLDDVALTGNAATGNGGGLYADGFAMTLQVRNSTISGNTALGGGGAYIEDTNGVTRFDGVVVDANTATNKGGGIFFYDPDGDVVVNNATVTNNTAAKGGGIYLYSQDNGSFTISNSTVSGNHASTGGGIYLYDIDHPVSISNTTISGNTAVNGAGINIDRISAAAVISSSTISGNTATGSGGGARLARGGGLAISHSTITQNTAADGGGAKFPGPVTLSHTILAGNTAPTTADLIAAGGVTADFSVLGAMTGAVTDGGGNQLGVLNPMVAPLANNGGPTRTHLPLAASPALDTGNPAVAGPATDQRGLPRVVGRIDVGAVEVQGSSVQFDSTVLTVTESAATVAVSVTRTGLADLGATVTVSTANGSAIAPGDYGTVSTQLSWAPRETGTKTVDIALVLDGASEPDETFSVLLTNPLGATLGANTTLTVTLRDSTPPTTTTLPAPTTTVPPAPTTTAPAPTATLPAPTTTVPPAPTTTAPRAPTTTLPAPTTTLPAPTTTVPAPTTTAPAPTTTPPQATSERLYAPSVVPPESVALGSAYPVETAQRVDFTCAGTVTGIWWFRTPMDRGVNTVTAWRGTTVVGQASGDPGATGWVRLAFATPITVAVGDQLIVGVHHPNGSYGTRVHGFRNRTVISPSGCLVLPATSPAAPSGLYRYTAIPALPSLSYDASEYFISPDFTPAVTAPPPPPPPKPRLYSDSVTPPGTIAIGSRYPVETVQRITFRCNGLVNGVWWYRVAQDTGVNTVTAWRGSTVVGQAAGNAPGFGWTFLPFASPVPVRVGDQLLFGVHHPNGAYGHRVNGFDNRSVSAGCLTSPASVGSAPNGMYAYSPVPVLPTLSYLATEYFIGPDFTET